MYKFNSLQIAGAIDTYCDMIGKQKRVFHAESGISSATLTQWRKENPVVSPRLIKRLEEYTGMDIDTFMRRYGEHEQDETEELRQMLLERPEAKLLFQTAKNAPTSAILEAAAILARYREENEKNVD